ncbi:acyl-coenzyme A thioesterase 13 [Tanacetum coccineum]
MDAKVASYWKNTTTITKKVRIEWNLAVGEAVATIDELEITTKLIGTKGSYKGILVVLKNKSTREIIAEGRHQFFTTLQDILRDGLSTSCGFGVQQLSFKLALLELQHPVRIKFVCATTHVDSSESTSLCVAGNAFKATPRKLVSSRQRFQSNTEEIGLIKVLADIQMDYNHPKKFGYQKDNQAESNSGRKSNNSSVEAKSTSRNASASVSKLDLRMKGKMKANDQENIVEAHITPLNLVDPMSDDLTVVDKLGLLSSSSTLIVDDEETHVLKQFVTGKVIKYVKFMNGFQYKKSNNNMIISCIEVAMLEEDSPAIGYARRGFAGGAICSKGWYNLTSTQLRMDQKTKRIKNLMANKGIQ